MQDFNSLLVGLKKASVGAIENNKPTDILFGTVAGVNPIKIFIDEKLTLSASQLILSRNVTDFSVSMTVSHNTENASGGSGYASFESHNHSYKGVKSFTIHNALKISERVILVRVKGGQKFVVIDRLN